MQTSIEKALTLLEMVSPDLSREDIAKLAIGERDVRLLTLREKLFGSELVTTSRCPHCEEIMEWDTTVAELQLHPIVRKTQNLFVTQQDYLVEFRLPNSLDLKAISDITDVALAQQYLLRRYVNKITSKGKFDTFEKLPKKMMQKIFQKMEASDPQADLSVELNCAKCQHSWDTVFDIVSFLWAEINDWAKQLLRSVHTLSRFYGWSEYDILNMSASRRQLYLQMVSP